MKLNRLKAVLFDLDGTLIGINMNRFVASYLKRLTTRMSDYNKPHRIVTVLRSAVSEMLKASHGSQTMEDLLCSRLADHFGIAKTEYQKRLEVFCREDLPDLKPLVQPHPISRDLVEVCLKKGWQAVVATNPVFPRAVIEARLGWGGLEDLPFAHISSYETAKFCKPHRGYFLHLAEQLNVRMERCLMVGNDTHYDLAAGQFGLQTCLLTPWRIDRSGKRYAPDWQGDHSDLLALLSSRLKRSNERL